MIYFFKLFLWLSSSKNCWISKILSIHCLSFIAGGLLEQHLKPRKEDRKHGNISSSPPLGGSFCCCSDKTQSQQKKDTMKMKKEGRTRLFSLPPPLSDSLMTPLWPDDDHVLLLEELLILPNSTGSIDFGKTISNTCPPVVCCQLPPTAMICCHCHSLIAQRRLIAGDKPSNTGAANHLISSSSSRRLADWLAQQPCGC